MYIAKSAGDNRPPCLIPADVVKTTQNKLPSSTQTPLCNQSDYSNISKNVKSETSIQTLRCILLAYLKF